LPDIPFNNYSVYSFSWPVICSDLYTRSCELDALCRITISLTSVFCLSRNGLSSRH